MRAYEPGPQRGSVSKKLNKMPRHSVRESVDTTTLGSIAYCPEPVLSRTDCIGKPEALCVGDCVTERVIEGVALSDADAELLEVSD